MILKGDQLSPLTPPWIRPCMEVGDLFKSIAIVFNVIKKPKSIPNPKPNIREVAKPAWAPTLAANQPVRSAKQKCQTKS